LMQLWSGLMSIIFAVIGVVTWILGLFKRKPSSPPPSPTPASATSTSPSSVSEPEAEPAASGNSYELSGSRFGSRLDTPKKRPVDESAESDDDADQPARSSYRRGIRLKSDED